MINEDGVEIEHGMVVYEPWKGGYYRKSEADKVIEHNKYKRCLAMAKRCEAEAHKCLTQQCALVSFQDTDRFQYLQRNFMHFSRWHKRWLELAEQFKEAK